MDFEQMNAIQRRLHNAACVLGADGDEHGFEQLQRDATAEIERLRTQLAHWKVFGEHAEGERSKEWARRRNIEGFAAVHAATSETLRADVERLKHNEVVMTDALYKACGDDEEMVRQTINSQGVLRPDPALLASGGA
jgi:hypothetical protein